MSVQVICIEKDSGNHENPYTAITKLGWQNIQSRESGKCTRLQMYDFIKKGNQAFVIDRYNNKAYLTTGITSLGTKYVKTIPDSTKTDNLLSLGECRV